MHSQQQGSKRQRVSYAAGGAAGVAAAAAEKVRRELLCRLLDVMRLAEQAYSACDGTPLFGPVLDCIYEEEDSFQQYGWSTGGKPVTVGGVRQPPPAPMKESKFNARVQYLQSLSDRLTRVIGECHSKLKICKDELERACKSQGPTVHMCEVAQALRDITVIVLVTGGTRDDNIKERLQSFADLTRADGISADELMASYELASAASTAILCSTD